MKQETWEQYENRVRDYIIELKNWHGSQHALAQTIGTSDTTISLFINGAPLRKYPVILKYLIEVEGFDEPPPVDPRPRRWMRTDNEWLALLIFVETYPEFPLYIEVDPPGETQNLWSKYYVLLTPDLIREFLSKEK